MNDPVKPGAPRPFAAGFAWLTTAAGLLRDHAARLLLIGLLFQLLGGAMQIGILGLFFIVAVPALTAGMLQAVHLSAAGERPSVLTLFAAFPESGRLLRLFLIGVLTVLATLLVVGFFVAGSLSNLDPALAARIQSGDQSAVLELDPNIVRNVLLATVTGLLLGLALSFFAVPLIWFQDRTLGDALVTGIRTLFREVKALTALGIGLAAIGLPVGMVALGIATAQLSTGSPNVLLTVVLMVAVVVYQVLAFTAQYVAFRELFGDTGAGSVPNGPDNDPGGDDQLVA